MKSKHVHGVGKEFPHTDIILYITLITFLLIWSLDSFLFMFSTILSNFIPLILRIILFIFLLILAIVCGELSHKILFGENRNADLITTGIFARVRHPLYLSIILIFLGLIFLTMSIISIIIWVFIFILFNKMATYEEKDLEKIFGAKYLKYKKRVPKWFPKFFLSEK